MWQYQCPHYTFLKTPSTDWFFATLKLINQKVFVVHVVNVISYSFFEPVWKSISKQHVHTVPTLKRRNCKYQHKLCIKFERMDAITIIILHYIMLGMLTLFSHTWIFLPYVKQTWHKWFLRFFVHFQFLIFPKCREQIKMLGTFLENC